MKLFRIVSNKTQTAPSSLEFSDLVLSRLSIMEATAAIKFIKNDASNPEDEATTTKELQKKCEKAGYTYSQTESILCIFKELTSLGQLIQTNCMNDWVGRPQKDVQKEGLASALAVTGSTFPARKINDKIAHYLNQSTSKILALFSNIESINTDGLDRIKASLSECYSGMDTHAVSACVSRIMFEINQLKKIPLSLDIEADIDQDYVDVDVDVDVNCDATTNEIGANKNSFFQPSPSTQTEASPPSFCIIS